MRILDKNLYDLTLDELVSGFGVELSSGIKVVRNLSLFKSDIDGEFFLSLVNENGKKQSFAFTRDIKEVK